MTAVDRMIALGVTLHEVPEIPLRLKHYFPRGLGRNGLE